MKKIMGVILSCLMFFNSAFNLACAANTETKNVSHSSKETRNKILKYVSVGALAAVGLLTAGGLAYAGYNYFSDTIEYPLIFDFDSKSLYFCDRIPQIKQMISKYQKSGKEFVVITQIEESEYVIECFDSGGNTCSIMRVYERQLNYLLFSRLYKVEQLRTGVYPGTEIMFKMMRNKILPPNEENYNFTLRRDYCTLTAVFYDNDETLKKFKNDALESEFIYSFYKFRSVLGFDKEIPNNLKKYEMNTCHNIDTDRKLVTKMIFIDVRKLKSMSESERGKIQRLLDFCTLKIVLFNFDNSKWKDYKKVDYSGDEADVEKQLKDAFENIYLSARTGKYGALAQECIRVKYGINVL